MYLDYADQSIRNVRDVFSVTYSSIPLVGTLFNIISKFNNHEAPSINWLHSKYILSMH
jgi:hypothetical protein